MKHWWEAPEWADKKGMVFGDPVDGPARPILTGKTLGEANSQRPERVLIFHGGTKMERC